MDHSMLVRFLQRLGHLQRNRRCILHRHVAPAFSFAASDSPSTSSITM
jgi:hypothetical protein